MHDTQKPPDRLKALARELAEIAADCQHPTAAELCRAASRWARAAAWTETGHHARHARAV